MHHDGREPELLSAGPETEPADGEPSTSQRTGPQWAQAFSAEAFSIATLLITVPTLIGVPGLIQTVIMSVISSGPIIEGPAMLGGFGVTAAAGAMLALGAVARSSSRSQPWACWLAGGALIVDLLIVAGVAAMWTQTSPLP